MAFSALLLLVIIIAAFVIAGISKDRAAERRADRPHMTHHARIILIHGWGGNPHEAWMPDFIRRMTAAGYEVVAPEMPDRSAPRIETWIPAIAEAVGTPDGSTHFVGHSIGCQAILRYLAGLPEFSRVGHVVLVAPWMNLTDVPRDDDERSIARPWLTTPIDTDAVRRFTEDVTCIMSDDDPEVPLSDADVFREKLDARVIIEHGKGHMSEDSGITELPSLVAVFV